MGSGDVPNFLIEIDDFIRPHRKIGLRSGRLVCWLLVALAAGCSSPTREAEQAVRKVLNDPHSAEFREVRVKGDHVCGEVNAKNAAGGYPGFRRFYISQSGKGTVVVDPRAWATPAAREMFGGIIGPSQDTTAFEAVYDRVCA